MILGARCIEELPPLAPIDGNQLVAEVARRFRVSVAELLGPCRDRRLARARQLAALLLRVRPTPAGLERSFPRIGEMLGGRDHSTICHAVVKCFDIAARDADFCRVAEGLAQPLSAQQLAEREELDLCDPGGAEAAETVRQRRLAQGKELLAQRSGRHADLADDEVERAAFIALGSLQLAELINRQRSAL